MGKRKHIPTVWEVNKIKVFLTKFVFEKHLLNILPVIEADLERFTEDEGITWANVKMESLDLKMKRLKKRMQM